MIGLGFPGEVWATIHTQSRQTQIEVRFSAASTRFPQLDAVMLVRRWKETRFLKECVHEKLVLPAEPMHMMAVMMRAQESYDAFLTLQHAGGSMRLVAGDAPHQEVFYDYQPGGELRGGTGVRPLEDLALAACLGPLGIGLAKLHGSRGQHRYEMEPVGLPIRDSAGEVVRYRTADLIAFATTGERRLALEDVNPHHPLVIGYDGMEARKALKKEIQRAVANVLITANDGSAKQALIALDHKGHVGDAVCRHLKAPPGSLGL